MISPRTFRLLLSAGLLYSVVGCDSRDKPEPPAPDETFVEIGPDVRLPENDEAFRSADIEPNRIVLHLQGALKHPIEPGSIVIGESEGGYLRRAVSVSTTNDTVTVETTPATLEEAFANAALHVVLNEEGLVQKGLTQQPLKSEIELGPKEFTSSGPCKLSLTSGTLGLDSQTDVLIRISNFSLEHFEAKTSMTWSLDASATLGCTDGFSFEGGEELKIASVPFNLRVMTSLGALPIKGRLHAMIALTYAASGGAYGSVTVPFTATGGATVGAMYASSEWSDLRSASLESAIGDLDWQMEASASIQYTLKPVLTVELYSVGGPEFSVERQLELAGEWAPSPGHWAVTQTDVGKIALQGTVPIIKRDFRYEAEVFKMVETIDEGTICDLIEKAPNPTIRCVDRDWAQWQVPEESPLSYSVTGPTVTDSVTGLVWERGSTDWIEWGTAKSYCENLVLGGHANWRLPTIIELSSITDETRTEPAINTFAFPQTSGSYWSSTISTDISMERRRAWVMNFSYGSIQYSSTYPELANVRCVR